MYKELFIISAIICISLCADNKYTSKYDKIDVDAILNNERVLKRYMDCLLDRGRCTPEGTELRKYLPDALETECSKCTDAQKKIAGKVMSFLLQNRRNYWNELLAKYDPEGKFRKKYEQSSEDNTDYSEFYD
ncbi:hypothetical protein O3M35_003390 [Rhynocoris fuscipes]|uniref:Chemosensory protein n=1 Tax=Rhynocoris fuscipes TaxID=488301 RepID=A0AAW1CRE9_9HEMI